MLADMGIEVWVRRTDAGESTVEGLSDGAQEPPAEIMVGDARPPLAEARSVAVSPLAVSPAPATTLDLTVLSAAGAVVVGPAGEPSDQKLMQGVLLAVAKQPVRSGRFVWPQTGYRDQSDAALETAYRAFLTAQVRRTQARILVLMGSAAQRGTNDEIEGAPVVRSSTATDLRTNPAGKRNLWIELAAQLQRS